MRPSAEHDGVRIGGVSIEANAARIQGGGDPRQAREDGSDEAASMPDAVDGDLDLPLAVQALVCALDHCEGYRRALGGAIGGDEHVIVGDLDDPIPRAGGDGGNRLARSPSRCSRRRDMTEA